MSDTLKVPMFVARDYDLPSWVGERALVIGSSFSGNTEETLSAFAAAAAQGARRVAVSSGGKITAAAEDAGDPVVPLPPGGQPRAALGDSLASVLGVLHAARLIEDPSDAIADAAAHMRGAVQAYGSAGEQDTSTAIAQSLVARIAMVYVPQDLDPVGRRWKAQLNENAKVTAAWDTLPELNHNAIVGYEGPPAITGDMQVIILDGPRTHERTRRRVEITRGLLADAGIPHTVVTAPGCGSRFGEAMWMVQVGDLASVHLALARAVDPSPVAVIERLKAALG
jgi:glucose/mannose-6-phosphate isomerase